MTIDDYFAAMERSLRQNRHVTGIDESLVCLASDDYNGLIRGRVIFWDGSYLDLYEVVSTELGYPVRVGYAYTYLRAGRPLGARRPAELASSVGRDRSPPG